MAEAPPRVVLLSLDAFNHHLIDPELTPRLWEIGQQGGMATDGGRCDLPSVTYPSHATMLTGRRNLGHGVASNLAANPRPGVVPGWVGRATVQSRSLFAACRAAGLRSGAVLGDQHLYSIVNADAADVVWPEGGTLPAGTPVDPFGYALNAAVRGPLLAAVDDRDLPFLFGHINETDTWGHIFGPDHVDSLAIYAATDALIGEVADALTPDWGRSVLIVLSDHGMEAMAGGASIDLLASPNAQAIVAEVVDEGGAAYVRLREGVGPLAAGAELTGVPGVVDWRPFGKEAVLVIGAPGVLFSTGSTKSAAGVHGGPGTQATTALIGGGHPAVATIANAIRREPPHLSDWAPTIAGLLGIEMPEADGNDLGQRA